MFGIGNSSSSMQPDQDIVKNLTSMGNFDELNKYYQSIGFDPAAAGGGFGSLGDWGSALGGIGSLAQAYLGYQQLGQAEDQWGDQMAFANRNMKNQSKLTNAKLEGMQRGRIAGTGNNNAYGQYESLNSYMPKNRVDGSAIS